MLRGMRDGEQDWGQRSPCPAKDTPPRGALWAGAGMATAALPFGLHLSGMLQSQQQLFTGARGTQMGSPHSYLVLGTALTSPCEVGVHVQSVPHLLSLTITVMSSQAVQSQMKQGVCSLFGLTGGKRLKPLVPRRHKMKLGVAGVRAPCPPLLGQEIPTQAKPSP